MNRRHLIVLFALLLASITASAQTTASAAGHWEGAVDTPNGQLGINVDIARQEGGKWAGEIGIPSQGLSGYPLSNLKVEGASVYFEMRGAPGVPTFNGKLSDDGKTISGEMTQGGAKMPFKIERKGEAKLSASAAPAKRGNSANAPNVEGSWQGTLDVGGNLFRLVLKISKAADGSVSASLDSPDQERLDLPITSIDVSETSVRFELKYLSAYFEGKLNKDLTEMKGDWYQGGASIPLILKRVAKAQ